MVLPQFVQLMRLEISGSMRLPRQGFAEDEDDFHACHTPAAGSPRLRGQIALRSDSAHIVAVARQPLFSTLVVAEARMTAAVSSHSQVVW